jgi:hypothetical protein
VGLNISEHDKWHSLRLGTAADFWLLPRVKVSGEVAYLPYVKFTGVDTHIGTAAGTSPESGTGMGVQLEGTISYYVTDRLSLGVGGRYWSMWTTSGDTNFAGSGTIIPQRFAVEQAALMLQGSYKFGVGPVK